MAGIWDDVNTNIFNPEKPNAPGVLSDVRRASGQFVSGVGSTLRDIGAEEIGRGVEQYGAGVARRNPSEIQSFEDVISRPFTTAREAVGEVVPQVGLAVGGSLAGRAVGGLLGSPLGPLGIMAGQQIGGVVGGLLPVAAQTYGGIRSEQRAQGIDDRPRALGATIPAAALERLGAERIAGKLIGEGTQFLARETGESLWKAIGKQAARGGLEETITEVPQTALERYGAYKPLTGPEAFDEYGVAGAKAFLGGGAIRGGLSAVAGQRPGLAEESDLTQPLDTTTRPDPSQFVMQDQTVGLKKFIDETTGVVRPLRKDYAKQFEAAFSEPSGQFVADAATGVERELTVGELMQRGSTSMDLTQDNPADTAAAATAAAKVATTRDPRDVFLRDELKVVPNPNSRQLFTMMEEQGIDPTSPAMVPVWNYAAAKHMTPSRLTKATELMDKAIIESRKEAPSGTGISTVQQPAGSVGAGSPVVPGVVADTGSPVAAAGGGVQPTGAAGAAVPQAGVLPVATSQPTAAVAQPLAPGQFRRAPKPMTVLEAARAVPTPPAAPVVAETVAPEVDQRQAILQQIFGQRNGDIIFDVVGMGMPEPEAAAKYGLSRQAIQKIAGATGATQRAAQIQRAKAEKGITDEQIAAAFQVAPQEELGSEVERDIFGAGRTADAITETEAIEGGLENIVKTAGAGTSEVEGFTKLQREIDATLEALATETDEAVLAELNAALAAQVEKVKAVEKKAQGEVRRTAGKVTEPTVEGEADAIQVESPAGVSVQPKTEAGKGVGGQVRRAKKPAAEGKAQAPAKVLTEAEQAAQAWDKVAADFPEAPKFADLTKAQQQDFIEFGPDNWERADVELELTKLANRGPILRALRTVTTVDEDKAVVELQEQELSRLETIPGVGAATDRMRKEGLGNLIDYVGGWYVTDSKVNWDGGFTAIDGQAAVLLRRGALTDSQRVEWTVYHEVGHAADRTHLEGGGVFSGQPEFNVRLEKGQIKPMGKIMKAAFDHYTSDPTSDLSKHLSYPFDRTKHGDLDGNGIREELFAQLWATYTTRDGREFLEDNLPEVADFMEQAYEQVKQTNYATAAADEAQRATQAGGQATQGNGQPRQVPLRQTAVRFRASRPQGLIDRNIAKLPKQSQQPVKRIAQALGDLGGKYLDYAVFTNELVKRAQALGLGAAKIFADRLAARNAKVSEEERKIEKIADGYALIEDVNKGRGPGSANEFLFESTRTGKWGYGKYRDAAMGAAFDKLGPKAQQFVKDVFAHGDAMLSSKKRIVLNATNSEYDAMIKAAQDAGDTQTEASLKAEKAATLKRFQTLFRIREGVPYAPIKRTGTYAVVAESDAYQAAKANQDTAAIEKMESDPNHYSVSFVDTKWESRNLEDSLAEEYPDLNVSIVKRAEAMDDFSKNALMPALTRMRSAVTTQNTREDGKIDPSAGKLLNIINQLYLEALAEGSARKSEMRRRGVAGEVDMLQSFTQQGRADANFLASVEYEPKIQDALQQMRNQSRTGDRERKSEIFDELTQRYADSLEPKSSSFINGLTNMASKFFLASSPGYYIQNLTQPFMMSLPAMAGRHNYTKAAKELYDAYAELGPLFKDVKLFAEQFDFSKVPDDVREAINDLVNQGKIDIGLATEINEYKVDADGNLSKFAQRLNKGMRLAVQKVEATNRLATAIAAYRLEFAKTKDAAKATQYAADILTDTHGDYTAMNAPRAFNTQWGKVALQFRKFQLIQIAFYYKLIRDAFTKPEERAAALRTLVYSLGHTGVFAGMMGIPGYAAAAFLLGLAGDEDEPYDLTADIRKAIGPEWADMIMRGAPTLAGMDLSGKIGSGNMLSVMPFSDADLTTTSGQAEAFGTFFGGAALGMTSRVADGLLLMLKGDYYKGLERTMPKGVSDALKAGRQASEGMTRRNGDVILPESEVSALDSVWTAIGVPSAKQAVTYERQNRMRDVTENFSDRTARIKNDYAKAVRQKDTDGMAEARAAWTKLQQTRQRNGLKPQPVSALLKAPQEQKAREQRTVGGVAYREGQKKLAESVVSD